MKILKKILVVFLIFSTLLITFNRTQVVKANPAAPYVIDLIVVEILEALGVTTGAGALTSNYGQEVEDLLFETIPGSDYFSKDVNGNITVDYGAIATNPDFIEGFINLTSSLQGSTLELEKTIDSIPISLGSPITVQPFDFSVADVNNIAYFNNTYNATVSVYLDFYDNETGKAYSNFVNVPPNSGSPSSPMRNPPLSLPVL